MYCCQSCSKILLKANLMSGSHILVDNRNTGRWSLRVTSIEYRRVSVEVKIPPDALIGRYNVALIVETETEEKFGL